MTSQNSDNKKVINYQRITYFYLGIGCCFTSIVSMFLQALYRPLENLSVIESSQFSECDRCWACLVLNL